MNQRISNGVIHCCCSFVIVSKTFSFNVVFVSVSTLRGHASYKKAGKREVNVCACDVIKPRTCIAVFSKFSLELGVEKLMIFYFNVIEFDKTRKK